MKKILALVGCLSLSVILLCGCSAGSLLGMNSCSGTTTDPIVSTKPWANNNNYEFISYDITRQYLEPDAENENKYNPTKTEASGSYTVELYTIPCNIYDWEKYDALLVNNDTFGTYFKDNLAQGDKLVKTPNAYSLLIMNYSLTYTDEQSEYFGKTDSMQSIVLFKTASLAPAFSAKVTQTQTVIENNYTSVADYVNGKNVFVSNQDVVNTDISTNATYDNELLYYAVRASSSLALGGSASLSVHNSVYTGLNKSETMRDIQLSVATNTTTVSGIDKDKTWLTPTYFDESDLTSTDENSEGYTLPAYAVNLQLIGTNFGQVKTLYYSAADFNFAGNTTSKILLKTMEYDTDANGIPTRQMTSVISNYKVSPLM